MRWLLCFAGMLLMGGALSAAQAEPKRPHTDALERLKALPTPLQSSSGAIFVSCASADRAALRWPVMRFAETINHHLSTTYLPLGSTTSPLSIELGAQTNAVSTINRRIFRTGDGFSQLVLQIPNPETVDLEILREGVAEALLRENVRERTGRYAAYTWPQWFLRALLNAAKGNLWKAEAYERLQTQLGTAAPPSVTEILNNRDHSTPELDAFFLIYLLEASDFSPKAARASLLTTPDVTALLSATVDEAKWQAWFAQLNSRVFLPGALTRSQFNRWLESLTDPTTPDEAVKQANAISRSTLARPLPFRDLADLYLAAYTAYINKGEAAYRRARQDADEAAAILKQHFTRYELLTHEPPAQPAAQHGITP